MESNVNRKPLSENEIVRFLALILGNARAQVEKTDGGETEKNVLKSVEKIIDHLVEITVDGGVIASWKYKPLEPKETF